MFFVQLDNMYKLDRQNRYTTLSGLTSEITAQNYGHSALNSGRRKRRKCAVINFHPFLKETVLKHSCANGEIKACLNMCTFNSLVNR